MRRRATALLVLIAPAAVFAQAPPADEAAEIAKKLNNPVAALISVPLQNNWDYGIGTTNAMKYTLNVQPVIPLGISKDWNVIVRTIMPIVSLESPAPGGSTSSGLGDITQSFFFSPKEPTSGGWIIGAGPALLYPSASIRAPRTTRSAPESGPRARRSSSSNRSTASRTDSSRTSSGRSRAGARPA